MSEKKAAPSIRARVRAEMADEIKRVALEHLAVDGAALSLRAVARDMGMVSSALYRYFPSRDDLLTALILDAYNSLGEAAEQGAATVADRGDHLGRWLATGHAIRDWAVARPHEYALVYGSPVPGYQAPTDTIEPSNRPYAVFAGILADATAAGVLRLDEDSDLPGGPAPEVPEKTVQELRVVAEFLGLKPSPGLIARFLAVLTQLFGGISFEVFGRLNNVIDERPAWFDWQLRSMAGYLGISPR